MKCSVVVMEGLMIFKNEAQPQEKKIFHICSTLDILLENSMIYLQFVNLIVLH